MQTTTDLVLMESRTGGKWSVVEVVQTFVGLNPATDHSGLSEAERMEFSWEVTSTQQLSGWFNGKSRAGRRRAALQLDAISHNLSQIERQIETTFAGEAA